MNTPFSEQNAKWAGTVSNGMKPQGGQIDWYRMETLTPGTAHSISDTFYFEDTVLESPVVTMQGYLPNSSELHPQLLDQITLVKK